MQVDNEIHESDLAAMERLDRDCLSLHLLPPPKTFIQLDVSDAAGKPVSSRKIRSQSWNRNAYNYVMMAVACVPANINGTTLGPGTLRMTDISGQYGATSAFTEYSTKGANVGGAGVVNKGIVIGKSNEAEDFNGVALKAPYAQGTAATFSALATPAVEPSAPSFDIKISPDGAYLVYGSQDSSAKVLLYKVSGDTLTLISGFGAELNTACKEICWSADSQYLVVRDASDMAFVYRNNGDDTFTMIHSITSYYGASVSPDGQYFIFSPTMPMAAEIHKIVDGVFTKVADINWSGMAIQQGGQAWSGDSKYLCVINGSSYVAFFRNNGDDTFTQIDRPVTLETDPQAHAWSKNGDFYVVSLSDAPYLAFYNVASDGTFTPVTVGISDIEDEPYRIALSQDEEHSVLMIANDWGYGAIYKLNNGTWTRIDTGTFGNGGKSVSICPDLAHFAFGTETGPDFFQYCAMQATINHLAQSDSTFAYDADSKKATVKLERVFNNQTSVSIPVRELGLYQYGSSNGYNYMMSRDVLASPVVIPPACKLTVTYAIEMTFPA